jgi:hypothetical protein
MFGTHFINTSTHFFVSSVQYIRSLGDSTVQALCERTTTACYQLTSFLANNGRDRAVPPLTC